MYQGNILFTRTLQSFPFFKVDKCFLNLLFSKLEFFNSIFLKAGYTYTECISHGCSSVVLGLPTAHSMGEFI